MKNSALILLFIATVCRGQMPPTVQHPQWLWFMAAQNTDGTNVSTTSNEKISPFGAEANLTCSNNLTPGLWTQLLYGRISQEYNHTNYWGTNAVYTFGHYTQPASVCTIACGGVPFLTLTNPPDNHWYTARPTARPGLWDIADSTNLPDWRDAFAFVTASNGWMEIKSQ